MAIWRRDLFLRQRCRRGGGRYFDEVSTNVGYLALTMKAATGFAVSQLGRLWSGSGHRKIPGIDPRATAFR